MLIADDDLTALPAALQPRPTDFDSGVVWIFAQTVGPAHLGAVTTPGAKVKTHFYAYFEL